MNVFKRAAACEGYTLLEVLIALFIFIAIAIPMLSGVISNTGALRAQEALTAAWLLEQEAASIRLFPDEAVPIKHISAAGKSWTVHMQSEGAPLVKYILSAENQGKKHGKVIFYAYRIK